MAARHAAGEIAGWIFVRVFFALWPDQATRAMIARAAEALNLPPAARLVPRQNYHLTLAFLGETPISKLAVLRRIGANLRVATCIINFDTYDYWPHEQVVSAVTREPAVALLKLRKKLDAALGLCEAAWNSGRVRAPRHDSFRPHITLARKVAQAPVQQAMSSFCWCARSFGLACSDTSGSRSIYTVVDTWPLLDETSKPQKSL